MTYVVVNATRNTTLGTQIHPCRFRSALSDCTGLLKQDSLEEGCGLWINPCEAIHTFFMRGLRLMSFSSTGTIAFASFDRTFNHGGSALVSPVTRSVLELPAGTAIRTLTVAGDRLVFERQA